jgi:hypothetical protein
MPLSIFDNRELVWLHELARATGFSKDHFRKLVDSGDLIAVDMSATEAKRRKLAIHRDAWIAFERARTTSTVRPPRFHSKRACRPKATNDFLAKGKRRAS